MNIPNLPTDNLYKFIALSGIVLIILSLVLPNVEVTKLENKQEESSLAVPALQKQINDLNLSLSILESDTATTSMNKLSKQDLTKLRERIIELANKTYDARAEFDQNKIKSDSVGSSINKLSQELSFYSYLMNMGFVLMITGFILWYFRLQKYLDLIVKKEADKQHLKNWQLRHGIYNFKVQTKWKQRLIMYYHIY